MPIYFYFNECVSSTSDVYLLNLSLTNTLREYKRLKDLNGEIIDGILTKILPSEIFFNQNKYSLLNCIDSLDQSYRRYAYSLFIKYPFLNYLLAKNDEFYLQNEFTISVGGNNLDASNLHVIYENNSILFTMAIHDDLKSHELIIKNKLGANVKVFNLFGEKDNTEFIDEIINQFHFNTLNIYDKLTFLIGNNVQSTKFERDFNNCTKEIKEAIVEHFKYAINRKGVSKFYPDGQIIKDVSPEKYEYKILELRIFDPDAFRVYFYESNDVVYLASIEDKPNPKTQDSHIKTAKVIIEKLVEDNS